MGWNICDFNVHFKIVYRQNRLILCTKSFICFVLVQSGVKKEGRLPLVGEHVKKQPRYLDF